MPPTIGAISCSHDALRSAASRRTPAKASALSITATLEKLQELPELPPRYFRTKTDLALARSASKRTRPSPGDVLLTVTLPNVPLARRYKWTLNGDQPAHGAFRLLAYIGHHPRVTPCGGAVFVFTRASSNVQNKVPTTWLGYRHRPAHTRCPLCPQRYSRKSGLTATDASLRRAIRAIEHMGAPQRSQDATRQIAVRHQHRRSPAAHHRTNTRTCWRDGRSSSPW